MRLPKVLIYLGFKGISIGSALLILKYQYWLNVVNSNFPDATPELNNLWFFNISNSIIKSNNL